LFLLFLLLLSLFSWMLFWAPRRMFWHLEAFEREKRRRKRHCGSLFIMNSINI